jgi:alpha-tubulin suppressor-like RCC1 family protein
MAAEPSSGQKTPTRKAIMHARRYLLAVIGLALLAACSDDSSGPSHVPTSMSIALDTIDFGATVEAGLLVKDQNGATIDPGSLPAGLVLESSDTTVATVDSDALTVTGTGIGDAVITARIGEIEASATLPVRVGPKPAQRLVAGDNHNCLINSTGATVCWGTDDLGTLGDGDTADVSSGTPVIVAGDHSFSTLTAGYHTCALENGEAWCWGEGDEGALGNGSDADSDEPVKVAGGHTFAQISAGWGHVCALTSDGKAYCWGYNEEGEVGAGADAGVVTEPLAVDTDVRFIQLVASGDHTCALTRLGKTYCWGFGGAGALGTGNTDDQPTPAAVLDTLTFVSLSGGYYTECGLERTGRAVCWGSDEIGQAGNGAASGPVLVPQAVDATARFSMIGAASEDHLCAIERGANQLYCWGEGTSGQIGDGSTDDAPSPTQVPGFLATFITTGDDHTCAVDMSDDVYCWGSNEYGQIGTGTVDGEESAPVLAPSQVEGLEGVAALRVPRSVVSKSVQATRSGEQRRALRRERHPRR